jgi:hypothetical protein
MVRTSAPEAAMASFRMAGDGYPAVPRKNRLESETPYTEKVDIFTSLL